jgi:hypothetical protein
MKNKTATQIRAKLQAALYYLRKKQRLARKNA